MYGFHYCSGDPSSACFRVENVHRLITVSHPIKREENRRKKWIKTEGTGVRDNGFKCVEEYKTLLLVIKSSCSSGFIIYMCDILWNMKQRYQLKLYEDFWCWRISQLHYISFNSVALCETAFSSGRRRRRKKIRVYRCRVNRHPGKVHVTTASRWQRFGLATCN